MRFVFLTLGYHPDQIGGAYRYVAEVAERLAARGHEVAAIYPAGSGQPAATEVRRGVRLCRFSNPEGFFFFNWRRENAAAEALLMNQFDRAPGPVLTVLCHAYFGPVIKRIRHPAVYLFTGPWGAEHRFARQAAPAPWFRRWLDRLIEWRMFAVEAQALRRAARILTISRYYERELPRWHPGFLPPVKVISGGVDVAQFAPARDRLAVRQQWGVAENEFIFLAVRRLDPRMGLKMLLDGFARLAGEFPQARLWLAGKGAQLEELQGRIAAGGLSEKVRLLGFVPEESLPRLYQAADCTVMPSLDLEGFGLATVESLACGTPVIGSRAGATPELLGALAEALLYPANEADALLAKMKAVLNRSVLLPSRADCRAYVLQHFTWEKPVMALEQCQAELLGGGGR